MYHLNIPCAIKEMKLDGSDAQNIEDFKLEVAVLARLTHPNIVQFRGGVFEEGRLAYVLEMCDNGSLSFLLVRDDIDLRFERRIGWARQVVEALQYLHTLKPKLIHRDCKTDNVFITKDWQVRLGDFGLCKAKMLSLESAKGARTNSVRGANAFGRYKANSRASVVAFSSAAGTPAFMAPELLRGQPYSEKVDIYGFGIVLFELLQREWAWAKIDEEQIMEDVLDGRRPQLGKWVPEAMGEIYTACVSEDPTKRPKTKGLLASIKALPHGTWPEPPN